MGPDSLTDRSDRLRDWLGALPADLHEDDVLDHLGGIAATIAGQLGVPRSSALPAGTPVDIPDGLAEPDLLGLAWEAMMQPADRRRQGSHFTPRSVAETVVKLAVDRLAADRVPVVWDPTCGGGAFLLAAARALAARGHDPAAIVGAMYGTDIDPIALRVTDASLELWCGVGARPTVEQVDVLDRSPATLPSGFATLVVGNPPFLGQLTADTARTDDRREALADRFGAAARGYVDDVGLILLASVLHAADDGVVALLTPESLLGSTDASAVRESIAARGALDAVWIETQGAFEAAVDIVCPIVRVGRAAGRTTVHADGRVVELDQPGHTSWSPVLAAAAGVPVVEPAAAGVLGDLASVTAGFRQHFYGLQPAIGEATDDDSRDGIHRLVTVGAIDLLWSRWGERPIRFAGRTWQRPTVRLDRIEDRRVAQWFTARLRPKLLVASQTRVIEVIADTEGTMLPSVPVISVEPHDPADLWRLAAVLASPVASALIASTSAGTGLSRDALRIRAAALAELPLPAETEAWSEGATAARAAQAAIADGDPVAHRRALLHLGSQLGRAFHVDNGPELTDWWCDRIRFPEPPGPRVE